MDREITLPAQLTYNNINELLSILFAEEAFQKITIDFRHLKWLEISPMTALLGVISGWIRSGKQIQFRCASGSVNSYMQRMNFFDLCGVKLMEDFHRREPGTKFVPFEKIEIDGQDYAGSLSEKIAECVAPSPVDYEWTDQPPPEGFFEAMVYSVSELIKNVQQHSKGIGFVSAQFYPSIGETQVAIADTGIGIRGSFVDNCSPHASKMNSDVEALKLALEPKISSKTHLPNPWGIGSENAGVGLTLLRGVAELSGGAFALSSGIGFASNSGFRQYDAVIGYPGTFACFTFKRDQLDNFGALLENAKLKIDMSGQGSDLTDLDIDKVFK